LDMSSVGEHVASVLAAAEGAAQRIRSEAQQEAKETEQEAARAANEIRTRATQEAQAERASSRRLVDEAEVASRAIRAEADQYADDRRREAEAQAAQTVRDAERRAASIADTSDERNRVLLANIAESETRLRDLAQSLRGVAASLDDVVGNADTAELGDQELAPERLEDALRIDVDDGRRDVKGRR
jgi:vacuolar-type H+-ATPase subunit E/Vma4